MPPKAKFQRSEIISAALNIVREQGFDALTARSLGAKLGSSSRPIFTVFKSMDEVAEEVIAAAKEVYNGYIRAALSDPGGVPHFKRVGQSYINFSVKEPELFQLLFMRERENVVKFGAILPEVEENYSLILKSITDEYSLDEISAKKLYQHLWIYTHGIASLCTMKMCSFTAEEISDMMTEVFKSLLIETRRNCGDRSKRSL